jgi:putative hydrolase of the HAD superfamily
MQNKSNITTLFLDIGDVLLSDGWGHDFRVRAAEKFNLDQKEMEERHSIMFPTFEEGKITLREYLQRVVFYEKRDFTFDQFQDFMFSLTTPYPDMIAFIKKLKAQYGLKIVAVSNEARELNAYRINAFMLNEFIDFFISSCLYHPAMFTSENQMQQFLKWRLIPRR